MTIVEALATLPDLTADQRRDLDLDTRWTWAIIRRGRTAAPPSVRRYRSDRDRALSAWAKLDVRCGWALLVDYNGDVVERRQAAANAACEAGRPGPRKRESPAVAGLHDGICGPVTT